MKNYLQLARAGLLAATLYGCAAQSYSSDIKTMDELRSLAERMYQEDGIKNATELERQSKCEEAVLAKHGDISDMIEQREVVKELDDCEVNK